MIANKKITIIEIAKACGVSKTTVGDALNENKSFRVSANTKERIESAAKRLGYVPNHSAKVLRTQKTNIIGIMLPNPNNSFHGEIALKLQKRLADRGYTAFFVFWSDDDDVKSINRALRTFNVHGVDGIITAELPGVHFEDCRVPVIFWQNAPKEFDSVTNIDTVKTGYQRLVRMLKEKKCENFAILSPKLKKGRTTQILEVLKDENVTPAPEHIVQVLSRKTAKEAMKKLLLLKKRPDVLLCNNDAIALSAMSEAVRSGVKIPDEMRFVGFDGTDEAEFSYPSLTTFKVSVDEATDRLLELLFRRIENVKAAPIKISITPELLIRNSI